MQISETNRRLRILIIDDDVVLNPLLVRFLTQNGYQADAALTGCEGLNLAQREKPDLVLCDLDMPGMNGYEVLASIRANDRLSDLPVVFLTGRAEPRQIREGMNVGADDYLTKPVDPDDLLKTIQTRLARREIERKRAQEQMEKAVEVFAGVVRDLRDPLFVVLGYTGMLESKGAGDPTNERGPILERMQLAIERMQTILAESLFVARSRMQRLPFDPASADLRHICEMVVSGRSESGRIQLDLPATEIRIVVDVVRIRQVVENLISNALKFSTGQVQVSLLGVGGYCLLEVSDSGIGIPLAEQGRVGEAFFRATNAVSYRGNGLGLCIVKSCVEQQGGIMKISSTPGEGTKVMVQLPPKPPIQAQIGTPGVNAAVGGLAGSPSAVVQGDAARFTVMLVDDDPLVRGMLRDTLEQSGGARVIAEAGSGSEALLLLESHAPDVLFLDVHLVDLSGFDLLDKIPSQTSVIFLSHAEEHAVHAFDCEAVDFLLKPVSAERVLKSLERARDRKPVAKQEDPVKTRLDDTFLVKTLTEKRLVKVREIIHIAAYGEYTWVYWEKGKGAMLRKPLKQWLAELPGDQFLQVHRGAIVNLDCLEKVERLPAGKMQIRLKDVVEPIQVSLRLASALNRRLKGPVEA